MSNKDYRELQISSSQLVIIFLAIIILGVIIFLLGISVGKKQSDIVLASQAQTQMGAESITQEEAVPVDKPEEKAAQARSPEETKIATPKAPAKKTEPQTANWFVQVGAFQNNQGAQAFAEKFKKDGYNAIVLSPSSSDRSNLYRVRIGGYATKALADNAKAQMVRKDPKAAEYLVIQQR